MAFTAQSVSVLNGQDVVDVNSAESIENIKAGDFLQIGSFPLVEIKQAYKNGQGQKFIQLTKAWELTTQNNQPAIVIPTSGEFRAAVKALQDANILVNDNQQAMQDYQNKLGTVTFKKSDGTTTTVKTLKQIEVDNQAQMNAYHPYPWAMRKVEFEAMRATNRGKYPANGFVHKGKHRASAPYYYPIEDGLFTELSAPNILNLGSGTGNTAVSGESAQDLPSIVIAGVITELDALSVGGTGYQANRVKFPEAEDGTRTFDSATGESVKHATAALAFAAETETNKVVTDRVDMWGFEGFLREINDANPFVYKNGLIQSQAVSLGGISTQYDTSRPITYFAWYTGDVGSSAKGVNWQTATEAQRKAIATNPKNNIYFDDSTGKFYQWCVRGRSFAGFGNGDWENIDASSRTGYLDYSVSSPIIHIRPQGIRDAELNAGSGFPLYSSRIDSVAHPVASKELGIYGAMGVGGVVDHDSAPNGECYFLVCGTVPRLNKGAYHLSFNPFGTGTFITPNGSTVANWNAPKLNAPNERLHCFITPTSNYPYSDGYIYPIVSGGFKVGGITSERSGRPDGRYFDSINVGGLGGVCRDMRYSSQKLTAEDFEKADLKIKSGSYRGRQFLSKTKFLPKTVTVGGPASYESANAGGSTSFLTSNSDNPRDTDTVEFNKLNATHWLLAGDNGESMVIKRVSQLVDYVRWPFSNNSVYLYGSGVITSEFNSKFPTGTKLWVGAIYPSDMPVAYEYLQTEVIGHPREITLCDDLKEGWVGGWVPSIPDGIEKSFTYQKPVTLNTLPKLFTSDNGSSWTTGSASFGFNATNNTFTDDLPANMVAVVNYLTKAVMTRDALNTEVYKGKNGLGAVYASSDGYSVFGARGRILKYSLVGTVVGTVSYSRGGVQNIPLTNYGFVDGSLLTPTERGAYSNTHNAIIVDGSNGVNAFKALNYNVAKNQQGFIQYAYAQLTYDSTAGDWGDDGKIHIADNQTTMLDENGHTNLVGTACCVEPLGWL